MTKQQAAVDKALTTFVSRALRADYGTRWLKQAVEAKALDMIHKSEFQPRN
jgi:hypothetical protein